MSELYDFSDWQPTDPPAALEWLRENLREAFKAFGNGYWRTLEGAGPGFEWSAFGWDTDPVIIQFAPDSLQRCLIQEIDSQVPHDGIPRGEGQREWVRSVVADIATWRAALDAAEAHANAVLSRPTKEPAA